LVSYLSQKVQNLCLSSLTETDDNPVAELLVIA